MPMLQVSSARAEDGRLAALPVAAGGGRMLGLPTGLDGEAFHQLFAFEYFLDTGHDVLRLEWLAVVLAYKGMTANAGLRPEMSGELPAFILFNHNDLLALAENICR